MEEVQKDIDCIYKRLNEYESRVTKLESTEGFFRGVLQKNVDIVEHLSTTLQDVQRSLVTLNEKMEYQVKLINEMDKRFVMLNNEAKMKNEILEKKFQEIEGKSSFDILSFLKQNWGWIMVLLGVGIFYIAQFVKF